MPAPLLREERLVLLINEDRIRRAVVLGALFLSLGVIGVWIGAGGQGEAWLPFLGIPIVMAAAIAYVWHRTRCPRCERRVLLGRWKLPATCPRCGVALLEPADQGTGPAPAGNAAPGPPD